LSENRQQIDRLHEQVGLVLQAESETADGAESVLSLDGLGELVAAQLRERGFDPARAAVDAAKLVEAATHRLVLLTPRDEGVGFEIRSLQELMAARAITEGTDADVLSRLRLTARSPHWRNTWLLAAGRLLVTSERFEKALVTLLSHLDSDPQRLHRRFRNAPALSADILDDNLAAKRPNFEKALIQRVLTALDRPSATDMQRIAQTLNNLADANYRSLIFERFAAAANAGIDGRAAAALILHEMARSTSDSGRHKSIRIALRKLALSEAENVAVDNWLAVGRRSPVAQKGTPRDLVGCLKELTAEIPLSRDDLGLLHEGLESLRGSQFFVSEGEPGIATALKLHSDDPWRLLLALERDDIAASLDLAFEVLSPSHWAVETMFEAVVKPALNRDPVALKLLDLISEARAKASDFSDQS
jgi:hypothetical protein